MTDSTEIREQFWSENPVRRGWEEVKDLFAILKGRGYISGSYAAYMTAPDEPVLPNDIDIFATSHDNALELEREVIREMGAYIVLVNGPAVTFSRASGGRSFQIIQPHPAWKTFPDDILESFDLDVSRAVLVAPTVVLADRNVGLRSGKLLRINDPLRSLQRVMKYHRRGVDFNSWELLKLFQAWDVLSAEQKSALIAAARELAFPPEDDSLPIEDVHYDFEDGYRYD